MCTRFPIAVVCLPLTYREVRVMKQATTMKKNLLRVILASVPFVTLWFAQTASLAQSSNRSRDCSSSVLTKAPFCNPTLPSAVRVDDLISRKTLEEKVEQMMHAAPAIPRLGVPAYNWWSEGLHGVANTGYATVFPQAIGMAASFDPDLLHTEARVIATSFALNTMKICARKATAIGFTV
jgi:hypothetical protein